MSEDRLGFVPQGFIRCVVTVGGELEGLHKLPLEIDRQSDRDLVASVDILGWHFELVLTASEHGTEHSIRVEDVVLPGREKLEIVSFL